VSNCILSWKYARLLSYTCLPVNQLHNRGFQQWPYFLCSAYLEPFQSKQKSSHTGLRIYVYPDSNLHLAGFSMLPQYQKNTASGEERKPDTLTESLLREELLEFLSTQFTKAKREDVVEKILQIYGGVHLFMVPLLGLYVVICPRFPSSTSNDNLDWSSVYVGCQMMVDQASNTRDIFRIYVMCLRSNDTTIEFFPLYLYDKVPITLEKLYSYHTENQLNVPNMTPVSCISPILLSLVSISLLQFYY